MPLPSQRLRRGLTLVEVIIALFGTLIIMLAVAGAFSAAANYQRRSSERQAEQQDRSTFEPEVRRLLQDAFLTTDAADRASFFIGASSAGAVGSVDSISFTRLGELPSRRYLDQREAVFEDLNEQFGPQGGLEEVSLSPVPIGEAPVQSGVFHRTQRPADGDSTQGGVERQLDPQVTDLSFEFYNGVDWVEEWDTTTLGPRRLPAAVRVTYRLADEDLERQFVVRLLHSDATNLDPALPEVEAEP